MSDPFPFEADFDAAAEAATRGPLHRRDLLLCLVAGLLGAVVVGAAGVAVVIELALSSPRGLPPVALSGLGPVLFWLAGAVIATVRLVRRSRAWPAPVLALVGALLTGVAGVLWWLRATGIA